MANVLVNKTKIANGPNFVIKNVKKTVIILLTSSRSFFKTEIWSTAKNTIERMLPFVEKTDVMLFGIALTKINNGLEPVVPVWAVILSMLTLKIPNLLATNPTTPASNKAKTEVAKNPPIVL